MSTCQDVMCLDCARVPSSRGSRRRVALPTTRSGARGFICAEVMAFDELKETPCQLLRRGFDASGPGCVLALFARCVDTDYVRAVALSFGVLAGSSAPR